MLTEQRRERARSRSPTPRRRAAPTGRPVACFCSSGEDLHVLAAGRGRCSTTRRRCRARPAIPWARACRVREDPPDRELQVRHGVRDDGRAAFRDELELGLLHPHAVRQDRVAVAEQPEPVERTRRAVRRCARRSPSPRPRSRGSGGAPGVPRAPPPPRPRRATPRSRCRSPCGVSDGVDPRPAVRRARRASAARRLAHRLAALGVHPVDEREADRGAQPRVLDGARHRAPAASTCPRIGPCRCGSSRGTRGASPSRRRPRRGRASAGQILCSQPLHERQVAAVAAEERHRGVRVAVDEPREQRATGAVEDLVAGLGLPRRDRAPTIAPVDGPEPDDRRPSRRTPTTARLTPASSGSDRVERRRAAGRGSRRSRPRTPPA